MCCCFALLLAYTGMSSAASAALFYAARVGDVPAVFMAEPDDITVLSGKTYTILPGQVSFQIGLIAFLLCNHIVRSHAVT